MKNTQKIYFFHSKYLAVWLAPIPREILYNQLAPTLFRRCQQYTIDSMIGNEVNWFSLFARKGDCLSSELKKMAFLLSEDEMLNFWLEMNGRNAKIRET